MNRFKNQILLAAGFAVLAGIISGITAAPAIAAAVKAALIKNVDERGRIPYTDHITCADTGNCTGIGEVVPAGKRLVIERVTVDSFTTSASDVVTRVFLSTTNNSVNGFMRPQLNWAGPSANIYTSDLYGPFYIDAGDAPTVRGNITSGLMRVDAWVTGYLVDLSI